MISVPTHTTMSLLGIELTVDLQLTWARDLLATLADVRTVSATCAPLRGSLRIEAGSLRPARQRSVPLEPGLRCFGDGLLDEEYGVFVRFVDSANIVLRTEHSCPEWFSWALQLLALQNRALLVHAAGLELHGAGLLFAARGGFGKTALIADFVRRSGWRLLGDDLTLLTEEGTCYGYPRALVLHPEHRPFFPALFAEHAGPRAPRALSAPLERAGRTVKPLLRHVPGLLESARRHNPQALRVTPGAVFGNDRLAGRALLQSVVWLERRAGLQAPLLAPADESMPGRLFGSTIAEFDARCVHATNAAMALGILNLEETYGAWIDVVRSSLRGARCYALAVPDDLQFEQMPAVVHDVLAAESIIPVWEAACV